MSTGTRKCRACLGNGCTVRRRLRDVSRDAVRRMSMLRKRGRMRTGAAARQRRSCFVVTRRVPRFPNNSTTVVRRVSQRVHCPGVTVRDNIRNAIEIRFVIRASKAVAGMGTSRPSSTSNKDGVVIATCQRRDDGASVSIGTRNVHTLGRCTRRVIQNVPPFRPKQRDKDTIQAGIALPVAFGLG